MNMHSDFLENTVEYLLIQRIYSINVCLSPSTLPDRDGQIASGGNSLVGWKTKQNSNEHFLQC